MIEQLPDEEVKRMLIRSGIPISYQSAGMSLSDFGDIGAEVKLWFTDEGSRLLSRENCVVEFVAQTLEETSSYFMLARAIAISAIPVHCLHAQEICPPLLDDDVWEAIESVSVLCVEGLATGIADQFDNRQRGCLEWFIGKWLANGGSLIMLNDRKISNCEEFSSRFRNTLHALTKRQFKKG